MSPRGSACWLAYFRVECSVVEIIELSGMYDEIYYSLWPIPLNWPKDIGSSAYLNEKVKLQRQATFFVMLDNTLDKCKTAGKVVMCMDSEIQMSTHYWRDRKKSSIPSWRGFGWWSWWSRHAAFRRSINIYCEKLEEYLYRKLLFKVKYFK